MRHVFRATLLGWERKQEGIWFDSALYTKEEATAQFRPYQDVAQNGFPYTGYEYDGQRYHDFVYLGEFDDDKMPENDDEYFDSLLDKT